MPPTEFKLSKIFDSTRRISFPDRPSWSALASKISFLYDVPEHAIGVSYVDRDGDEITLSSDQELQDYYATSSVPGTAIKFTVVDVSVRHAQQAKSLPDTPRVSGGTFGQNMPMMFNDLDDDWQRIPGLGGLGIFPSSQDSDGPHAFVEVIPSDASVHTHDDGDSDTSSTMDTDLGEIIAPTIGKGKSKAVDQRSVVDGDSAISLLEDEEPEKLPVHVASAFDHRSSIYGTARPGSPSDRSTHSDATAIPTNTASAPLFTASPIPPATSHRGSPVPVASHRASPALAPAPASPNPAGGASNAGNADSMASLYSDLATFLTTAATVFAQHPELSEGVRNIVNNAMNGAYLNTYRETATQAVEGMRQFAEAAHGEGARRAAEFQRSTQQTQADFQRSAQQTQADAMRSAAEFQQSAQQAQAEAISNAEEIRRAAEEQASRRVADALGGILRAFVQPGEPTPGATTDGRDGLEPASNTRRPAWSRYNSGRSGGGGAHREENSLNALGQGLLSRYMPPGFVPMNPNAPHRPHPMHRPVHPAHNLHGRPPREAPAVPIPPRPPIPPKPTVSPPAVPRPPVPPAPPRHFGQRLHQPPVGPPPVPAPPAPPAPLQTYGSSRADLEAAKMMYKEAKDRYRRDREERRMRGENQSGDSGMLSAHSQEAERPVVDAAPPSVHPKPTPATAPSVLPATRVTDSAPISRSASNSSQLISNARGAFPRMEMVSVPSDNRRSSVAQGSIRRAGSRRVTPNAETGESSRPITRVKRRLADMGFSEAVYPTLPTMINMHLLTAQEPSQAEEDEIVTKLLEELLSFSPPRPDASSSRRRL